MEVVPVPPRLEVSAALYVYGRGPLSIECAAPARMTPFPAGPEVCLAGGPQELAVEPGVYLVRPAADLRVVAGDAEVIFISNGKPQRRTPRRLFKVLPAIARRALARFLRQPPPPPPRPHREIRRILVVDSDEATIRRYVAGFGPERGVVSTADPAEALRLARSEPFDLAIVEPRLKHTYDLSFARELKREHPGLIVVLCSGYHSVELAVSAKRTGIDQVLFKPVSASELLRRIDRDPDADPGEPDDAEAADAPSGQTPTLERAEWEHIERVLADCGGNISLAATRLGIYRSSLQRRLRKANPPRRA